MPCWRRKGEGGKRKAPPLPCPIRTKGGEGRAAHEGLSLLFSTKAHHGPYSSRGVPVTPGTPVKSRFHPEHFRYPNIGFQYINLYVSTISRLLVMSVISSGTRNNIRSPNHITHITLYRQRMLSLRTLRVRELCRHDRDTSPVNNQ